MLDNLDLFDQSRFGASEDKLRPIGEKREDMINYAGFGLDFEENEAMHEGSGAGRADLGAAVKGNKKADKVKR